MGDDTLMRNKYDWNEIQKYYDDNHTWEDIKNNFGCCNSSIQKAIKRGDLYLRNKSLAIKLAHKKYPESFRHTKETKEKISRSRKKYLEDNPEMVPYLLNHYSKGPSYPERYFKEVFEKENILLEQYKQIKYYQLDFYNDEKKIAIEIDGDQHYTDERIKESDKRKDKYLENEGWYVFRIKWSSYQKLSYNEKCNVVREIKELLEWGHS